MSIETSPLADLFDAGLAAHKRGDAAEALRLYGEVIAADPRHFNALHLSGLIESDARHFARAIPLFETALAVKPDNAVAWYNLGVALQTAGRDQEALPAYDRAIGFKPDLVQAHVNRGNLLRTWRRTAEALASYETALTFDPHFVPALVNRGIALRALGQPEAALESFRAALARNPQTAEALFNAAMILVQTGNHPAAIETLEQLAQFNPRYPELAASKLFTQMRVCDWRDWNTNRAAVLAAAAGSDATVAPYHIVNFVDDPALQKHAAASWTRARHPDNTLAHAASPATRGGKTHLGYFSRDFREHAVARLLAELIETHDRNRFTVSAFSFGPDSGDAMQERLASAFDSFIDIRALPDREAAARARAMGIDIAIDLAGHTDDARTGIFAARAAPVQVNFLGYPGTMGAPYYDYIIADPTLIPPGAEAGYTEKVVRMPHSYQPNDRMRTIGTRVFTRSELGLPAPGFVFCCFNNTFKIAPATFALWMRILQAVDGSVLWLLEDNHQVAPNLRTEAAARGIDPARLVFAPRAAHADHLSRHRAADLFLDTLPYNAHTTTSDALWCGLPVLTLMGQSFAARVAAGLLNAVGLPELVTRTEDDYVALAIKLAHEPLTLAALRQRLQSRHTTAPLFDTPRFARDIEKAFAHMITRRRAGYPCEDFDVADL